ncbi:MAG TPA: tetratricopeptide repeat protein [Polyangiaceae bacterium]|nr:tetratricopeptide repeat protein [Polyangiaceae bacterium]
MVRSPGGPERVFGSLRDLRKAIDERTVSVEDDLSRDGGPFRPMRSVAELAALFRRVVSGPAAPYGQTLMGVGIVKADAEGGTGNTPLRPPPPGATRSSEPPARSISMRPGVNPPVVTPSLKPPSGAPQVNAPAGPAAGRVAPAAAGFSRAPGTAPAVTLPTRVTPPLANPPPMRPPAQSSLPPLGNSVVPRPGQSPHDRTTERPPPGALAAGSGQAPRLSSNPPGQGLNAAAYGASHPPIQALRPGVPAPGFTSTLPSTQTSPQPALNESLVPGTLPAGGNRTPLPPKGASFPPTRRSEPAEAPTVMALAPDALLADASRATNDVAPTTPRVRQDDVLRALSAEHRAPNLESEQPAMPRAGAQAASPSALMVEAASTEPAPQIGLAPTLMQPLVDPLIARQASSPALPAMASDAPAMVQSAADAVAPTPRAATPLGPAVSLRPSASAASAPLSSPTHAVPFELAEPRRRSGGMRWVIGFVVLGGLAVVGGTVGKNYLMGFARPKESVAVVSAASPAVEQAQAAFQKGQYERARSGLEQLSGGNATDPSVVRALMEITLAEADVEWLRLRIAPASDAEARAAMEHALTLKIRNVQSWLGKLDQMSVSDPTHGRAQIEVMRMQGRLPAARDQVERLGTDAKSNEMSYALAMLDLAEAEPAWSAVVSRLEQALVTEGPWGHSRPALIYASLRAGDAARARVELEKLSAAVPEHPLLAQLETFVGLAPAPTAAASASASANSEPALDLDAVVSNGGPQPKDDVNATYAARQLLDAASAARASGDLAGARSKYQQALNASPGNLAALSGLGGVARLEGKYQEAKGYYDQVLERNPDYPAAVVGGADVRWLMGNREGAVVLYRKVPAGNVFYSHAQHRIEEFEGKGPAEPGAGESPAGTPEPKPATDKSEPKTGAAPGDAPKPDAPKAAEGAPAPEKPQVGDKPAAEPVAADKPAGDQKAASQKPPSDSAAGDKGGPQKAD